MLGFNGVVFLIDIVWCACLGVCGFLFSFGFDRFVGVLGVCSWRIDLVVVGVCWVCLVVLAFVIFWMLCVRVPYVVWYGYCFWVVVLLNLCRICGCSLRVACLTDFLNCYLGCEVFVFGVFTVSIGFVVSFVGFGVMYLVVLWFCPLLCLYVWV